MSVEIDGVRQRYGGSVVVYETAREITFESNWNDAPMRWPLPTFMTIRLTPLYEPPSNAKLIRGVGPRLSLPI